jgi:hypothetical protein
MKILARFLLPLVLCLPASFGAAGEALARGKEAPFVLLLDGSTLAQFVMICDVIDGEARQQIRRKEYLRHSYRFAVDAIDCRVTLLEGRGRIVARLYEGERLIAEEDFDAIRTAIGVRSDGPWGRALAWRVGGIPVRPH